MSFPEWKLQILDRKYHKKIDEDGIVRGEVFPSPSLEFHKKMPKGSFLRELQYHPYHLSYWETPYYKKKLSSYIDIVNPQSAFVADIGCGDGRFTEMLLELGFRKIIASDIDIRPLRELSLYLKERNWQGKVLIIHSSIESLPIKATQMDAVFAIEVFYYMGDEFASTIKKAVDLLKPHGILINSEPDLEGTIYRSMFFDTLDDVTENFNCRRFKEEKGQTPYKFGVFTEDEVEEKLSEAGLQVLERQGISLLPLILRIMMLRGLLSEEEVKRHESILRKIFDFMDENGKLHNRIIWKSIKL